MALTLTGISRDDVDAYDDGVTAYYDGAYLCDNPYTPGTENHDDWYEGWIVAEQSDRDFSPNQLCLPIVSGFAHA
jgi:hypothetical protein